MRWAPIVAGIGAGLPFGYVLQRGQMCFHSVFRSLFERRAGLFKAWALGAAVAMIGLTAVLELGPWRQLSQGLGFRPATAIVGGVVFGIGMAVAYSCVSGLFYKLGAGMLGALVGLAGWAGGELAVDRLEMGARLPGSQVLAGGGAGTLHELAGLPRAAVALPLAGLVIVAVMVAPARQRRHAWQWGWAGAGVALGIVTTLSWVLAGASGASFGASTSGAVVSVADGNPAWWRVAFLLALVPGAAVAARTAGGWWLRGEPSVRYVQLAAGGLLMGGGARLAGGCNLGHGLSGVAQLNVSSLVVVAAMIVGVGLTRSAQQRVGGARPDRDLALRTLTDDDLPEVRPRP